MSYRQPVWPRRLGLLLAALVIGWFVYASAGRTATKAYVYFVVERCAASAGLAEAPWGQNNFGFDGSYRDIVGDSPERREVISCTMRWAGLFIPAETYPYRATPDPANPRLTEVRTMLGHGGFHFRPGQS